MIINCIYVYQMEPKQFCGSRVCCREWAVLSLKRQPAALAQISGGVVRREEEADLEAVVPAP